MSSPLQQYAKKVQHYFNQKALLDEVIHGRSTPEQRQQAWKKFTAVEKELKATTHKHITQTSIDWQNHLAK